MPRFVIEFRFDNTPKSNNISLVADLPIDRDTCMTQRLNIEEEQFTKFGDKPLHITTITALEDIPSHNIKRGDAVFRDWDDIAEDIEKDTRIRFHIRTYNPLWGHGSGYSELCQLLFNH